MDGAAGNGPSDQPRLDGAGQQLIFRSTATDLVSGPQNTYAQLYQHDLGLGATARVTTNAAGAPGGGDSGQALVAGDWVIYRTEAADLASAGPGLYRQHLYDGTRQPVGLDEWGTPDPQATRPAADSTGADIAYQRPEADGSTHIYVTEGNQAERLSFMTDAELGRLEHCCVAISPDGLYFAYREETDAGDAWLHVCNRTHCNFQRLPWPDNESLRDHAPKFSDDGSELLWIGIEQGPGLPEVLHRLRNPLSTPVTPPETESVRWRYRSNGVGVSTGSPEGFFPFDSVNWTPSTA